MKKITIILIAAACLLILLIQQFIRSPQIDEKQYDGSGATPNPSQKIIPDSKIVAKAETAERMKRDEYETTYRSLPGSASIGDSEAPANAVYLGNRFIQEKSYLTNDPNDFSDMSEQAKVFIQEDAPEQQVLNALNSLLFNLRVAGNKGYFDAGSNIELTNGLLGDNARKIGFISSKSPRINELGELVDQWGSPYFFHFISSQKVSVQSAGEDLILFTDDDIYPEGAEPMVNIDQSDANED